MYLLDTNIFLEILLGQEKANACEACIQKLSEENPGYITHFSLHAIEAIIGRDAKNNKILTQFLGFIEEHPHLHVYDTQLEDETEISKWSAKTGLNFDDALQYFVAKTQKLKLVTLDRGFQKIKDISIIAPQHPDST